MLNLETGLMTQMGQADPTTQLGWSDLMIQMGRAGQETKTS